MSHLTISFHLFEAGDATDTFLLQRWHSILIVAVIAGMVSGLSGVGLIAVINAALGRATQWLLVGGRFQGYACCCFWQGLLLLGQNAFGIFCFFL
ncbi:MAG: hypothetical protein ACREYF_23010 [Gammaproteobacteria bacterium]